VKLHVDRAGDKVRGYLAIYGTSSGHQSPLLACPADWDELTAREQLFANAEQTRLLYVAATRAGTQLVVAQKRDMNRTNYWSFFHKSLQQCDVLTDPGRIEDMNDEQVELTPRDVVIAATELESRRQKVRKPTYATAAAKEIALAGSKQTRGARRSENAAAWGTVIHLLLEATMRRPEADLEDLARDALETHGLNTDLARIAVETVAKVSNSDMWARAQNSPKTLVEVPFTRWLPANAAGAGIPTLLRGVIDLVFREPDGWVLVDYKTDVVTDENQLDIIKKYTAQVALYAESWEALLKEPVVERGLFFSVTGEYVTV